MTAFSGINFTVNTRNNSSAGRRQANSANAPATSIRSFSSRGYAGHVSPDHGKSAAAE
jgi:hypothetical protein